MVLLSIKCYNPASDVGFGVLFFFVCVMETGYENRPLNDFVAQYCT